MKLGCVPLAGIPPVYAKSLYHRVFVGGVLILVRAPQFIRKTYGAREKEGFRFDKKHNKKKQKNNEGTLRLIMLYDSFCFSIATLLLLLFLSTWDCKIHSFFTHSTCILCAKYLDLSFLHYVCFFLRGTDAGERPKGGKR